MIIVSTGELGKVRKFKTYNEWYASEEKNRGQEHECEYRCCFIGETNCNKEYTEKCSFRKTLEGVLK
jgi:hypothetical protein